MGGFGSGYQRGKRPTVEAARRLTLDEVPAFGVELVFQPMPRGRRRKMGICPKCQRPARNLYVQDERAACRTCTGLTYRSSQEQRKPARVLVKEQQPTLSAGLRALETWQQMPQQNQKEFSIAMATFDALTTIDGHPQSQPDQAGTQDSKRAATVEDDLAVSAKILRQLETAIADTPPDSAMLPKLINALVALSNLRDARARTADDLSRGRGSDGDRLTFLEIIELQMGNSADDRYRNLQEVALDSKTKLKSLE